MSSREDRREPKGGFAGLRVAALIATVVGAVVSVGVTIYAGQQNPSRLLILLFVVWVLAPFVLLGLADIVSKRWSRFTRATLYGLALVVALGSLVIYGYRALTPHRAQAAFVFVVVPPLSCLLVVTVLAIAGLISERLRRRDG